MSRVVVSHVSRCVVGSPALRLVCAWLHYWAGWNDNLWGQGYLASAVSKGKTSEAAIKLAVRRTLLQKMKVRVVDLWSKVFVCPVTTRFKGSHKHHGIGLGLHSRVGWVGMVFMVFFLQKLCAVGKMFVLFALVSSLAGARLSFVVCCHIHRCT